MADVADARGAIRSRLAQPRERVERRATRVGRVRIRAAIDEHRREIEVRVDDGHVEGAGAVWRHVVDRCAVIEKRLRGLGMIVADGEQQRRESGFRLRLHVCAVRDENFSSGGVAFRRRPHQRGLSLVRFDRIHVRAGFEQQLHRVGLAGERGGHERRLPFFGCPVRIGAGLQQAIDKLRVAVRARERQRRHLVARRGLHVGAGGDQRVGHRHVIALRRPVKRGRAVGVGRVDVHLLRDKRADGGRIAALRGVDELRAGEDR